MKQQGYDGYYYERRPFIVTATQNGVSKTTRSMKWVRYDTQGCIIICDRITCRCKEGDLKNPTIATFS